MPIQRDLAGAMARRKGLSVDDQIAALKAGRKNIRLHLIRGEEGVLLFFFPPEKYFNLFISRR